VNLDVPSIVAVLRTVYYSNGVIHVEVDSGHEPLTDYLDRLEAANASPRQSVLMTSTPDQTAVIKHIAEP
jgi:hypothetical protein